MVFVYLRRFYFKLVSMEYTLLLSFLSSGSGIAALATNELCIVEQLSLFDPRASGVDLLFKFKC